MAFPRLPLLLILALLSSVLAHDLAGAAAPGEKPHMVRVARRRRLRSGSIHARQDGLIPDAANGVAGAVSGLTGSSDDGSSSTNSTTTTGSGKDTAGTGGDNSDGGILGGIGAGLSSAIDGGGASSDSGTASSSTSSDSSATPAASSGADSATSSPPVSSSSPPVSSSSAPAVSSSSAPAVSSSLPPTTPTPTSAGEAIVSSTTTTSGTPLATTSAPPASSGGGGIGKTTVMAIGIVGGVVVGAGLLWTIIRKTRFSTSKRFNEKLNPVDFGDEVPFPPPAGLHRTDSLGSSVSRSRDEKSDWGGRAGGGGSEWGGSQRGLPGHGRNGSGGTEYTAVGGAARGYAPPMMQGYGAGFAPQGAYGLPAPGMQAHPGLARTDSGTGRSLVGMDGMPRQGGYYPQQPTLANPYDAYAGMNPPQPPTQRSVSPAPSKDPYYRGGY